MKLIEFVKGYSGSAKFDVDVIGDGEVRDAIVFSEKEYESVKDDILNADVIRYKVTGLINTTPTINFTVKLEEKQQNNAGSGDAGSGMGDNAIAGETGKNSGSGNEQP